MLERFHRELLNFLARQVCDRDTAADLVQESYARVYAALQAGASVRDPRALLYTTARHLVTDHYRRGAVRTTGISAEEGQVEADDCLGPAAAEPDALLASKQGVAAMVATIETLPPRCREAFMLYKFDGLSYAQVAQQMGISTRTVEMHLQMAMDACWRCLDGMDGAVGQPTVAQSARSKRSRSAR